MVVIDPKKKYTLAEVVGMRFIQGIDSYYSLYRLVAIMKIGKKESTSKYGKRDWSSLYGETTKTTLKAEETKFKPWTKTRRLTIKGIEILKFKKIHNML